MEIEKQSVINHHLGGQPVENEAVVSAFNRAFYQALERFMALPEAWIEYIKQEEQDAEERGDGD